MITDTTAEAAKRQDEILARLSGDEKVRLAMKFSDTVRNIAWAGFCKRHPSISVEALRAMFIKELHGMELCEQSGGQDNA